jgi:hypothetical protein
MTDSNFRFAQLDLAQREESALRTVFAHLDGGLPTETDTATVTAETVATITAGSATAGWQSAINCVRRNVAEGREPLHGLIPVDAPPVW